MTTAGAGPYCNGAAWRQSQADTGRYGQIRKIQADTGRYRQTQAHSGRHGQTRARYRHSHACAFLGALLFNLPEPWLEIHIEELRWRPSHRFTYEIAHRGENLPFFIFLSSFFLRRGTIPSPSPSREGAHMVPHSSRYYRKESIFEESLFVLVRLGGRNLDERGK